MVDDPTCNAIPADQWDGELAQEVNFTFWLDDGDNVFEDDETILLEAPLSSLLDANGDPVLTRVAIADSLTGGNPISGGTTFHIAKAWCFGALNTTCPVSQGGAGGPDVRGTGISCSGVGVNNAAQTDKLMGNVSFYAIQARHNMGYVCNP